MTFLRAVLSVAFLGVVAGPAAAQLQSGSYEIAYRLELPHLESWAIEKTATICVPDAEGSSPMTLPILSGNNPFGKCSAQDVRGAGAQLTYEIVCAGRDSARARAVYAIAPGRFQGRIRMVMGAKNMTMTEVQIGRRIGRCDLASASRD